MKKITVANKGLQAPIQSKTYLINELSLEAQNTRTVVKHQTFNTRCNCKVRIRSKRFKEEEEDSNNNDNNDKSRNPDRNASSS